MVDASVVKAELEKLPSITFDVQVDIEQPGSSGAALVITSAAPQGNQFITLVESTFSANFFKIHTLYLLVNRTEKKYRLKEVFVFYVKHEKIP